MIKAHIDFETFSTVDLKKAGSHVYSKSKDTEILCLAYAIGEQEINLWRPGDTDPDDLLLWVELEQPVVAHNMGGFEYLIWNNILSTRYGWPTLQLKCCFDTMPMAYAMSLPGNLDGASTAAGIDIKKDMKGHRVMLQLCKPRSINKDSSIVCWDKQEFKDRYDTLYDYCKTDVRVERELWGRLLELSKSERRLWLLDQKINNKGVRIDVDVAKKMVAAIDIESDSLDQRIKDCTEGRVTSCKAVKVLTNWVREQGIEIESVDKASITKLLAKKDLPLKVRTALELRRDAAKSSTAKIKAMLDSLDGDRIKGMFQYHGASTGRWAGRRVQLQNLPRSSMPQEQIEKVFNIFKKNSAKDALFLIDLEHGSPLDVISQCVRGLLIPSDGHQLMAIDFSSIEARVLAWLAGQKDKLDVFKTHGKIYEQAASGIFKVKIDEVTKDQRQIGKVAVLALGYGGGVGAFQTMAKGYGVEVSDERAENIKTAWREDNENIVSFWYDIEDYAIKAVTNPGKVLSNGKLSFRCKGSFLFIQLPSGRVLTYPYPKIENTTTPWGAEKLGLCYYGVNSISKKWEKTRTYGGKLAENITQAVARDLLSEAMIRIDQLKPNSIVAHVHDEVVLETKENDLHKIECLMSQTPSWASDLPIRAEGFIGKRYGK